MSVFVEHLKKTFDNQPALDGVSFEVKSGEIVGLIGPNGAGKSTLMKIICSLLIPSAGEVKVNNISVIKNPDKTKRFIGYLPENNPLYPDMYVREYLMHIAGIYKLQNKPKHVFDIIEMTGLSAQAEKKIGFLSKGFRQRVGLAQAIIHDPDILILDEPTTGLDPNQIVEIRTLISQLGKQKTILLSTHLMQEVEAICKRIIILNKGKIVADDLSENIGALSHDGSNTVIIEFNLDPPDNFFTDIPFIQKIKKLKNGTWLVECRENSDIRAELFKMAVKCELIILSMNVKHKKLEDLFRDLTS